VTEIPKGSEPLAKSLNIKKVCPQALTLSNQHPVVPITVSDAMSVQACRKFAGKKQKIFLYLIIWIYTYNNNYFELM